MKILLVTTWNERCGIAEYAKNLVKNCDVEFSVLSPSFLPSTFISANGFDPEADIVHINYEPGLFPYLTSGLLYAIAAKQRTVMTLHTSTAASNSTPLTRAFHKVIVHERTPDNFVHIPHGIVDYPVKKLLENEMIPYIGTFGFPFPWKGFAEVTEAAKNIGLHAKVIAAESPHWDVHTVAKHLRTIDPDVAIETDYLSQGLIIEILSRCAVNVFAYQGSNSGISGAVRSGLAARRPIVLSRCRQFRDLFDYEDEITFIEDTNPSAIYHGILQALGNPTKVPNRVLEDMSWTKAGKMYKDVYEGLL